MSVVATKSNLLFENDEWEMNKKLYDLQIQNTLKKRNLDGVQDQMKKLETRVTQFETISKLPCKNQNEIVINKYNLNLNSSHKLGNTKMMYDNCTCNKKQGYELTKYINEIKRLIEQKRKINSLIRKYNSKIIHTKNQITSQMIFDFDDSYLCMHQRPTNLNAHGFSHNFNGNKTINVKHFDDYDSELDE